MKPRVVVFADDLSGGNGIGAEFARRGLRTMMVRAPALASFAGEAVDVLVISTDTRNRSAADAHAILTDIAPRAFANKPDFIVKKLDSLLRGPIAAEAQALSQQLHGQAALVVAASPETGRTTIEGRQRVKGRPLLEVLSELDPGASLESDEIGALFSACGMPVRYLGLDRLRAAQPLAHDWVGAVTIADCETRDDLLRAVDAAAAAGVRIFFGTYGLGEALSRLLVPPERKPILIIAGSLSEATRLQVLALRVEPDCAFVAVDNPSAGEDAARALRAGQDVVLCARPDTLGDVSLRLREPPTREAAAAMERAVAVLAEPLLPLVSGLIVSGGSTADALLERIGAVGLRLSEYELLPGVPLMQLQGSRFDGMWCITKPGSFGEADALLIAHRALHARVDSRG